MSPAVKVALTTAQADPVTGRVWSFVSEDYPRQTGMSPASYAAWLPPGSRVRVLDDPTNDLLIRELGACCLGDPWRLFELGRPAKVDWPGLMAKGPEALLMEVATATSGSPLVGNWRRYAESDDRHAALRVAVLTNDYKRIIAAFRHHPAYPALSFLMPRDGETMARLLAAIGDPRYHVDPRKPDRGSRLNCFLGLANAEPAAAGLRVLRYRLAMQSWLIAPDDGDTTPAGSFLWRRYDALAGDPAATIKTTRLFVSYLRLAWLDALSVRGGLTPGQGPFVPAHFFAFRPPFAPEPGTARALERHLARR